MPVAERSDAKLQPIFTALMALNRGDASVRLPQQWTGIGGRVAEAFNELVERNARISGELERLSREVGRQGRLKQRIALGDASGFWRTNVESVNSLIDDLASPMIEITRLIGAVAQGDLSKNVELEVEGRSLEGEFLRTAKTVNRMLDQLNTFAGEVTRVAREVGTEGKLGGQAQVKGVSGVWRDLTDNVNLMAGNLTAQVRNIAEVTTAVAKGDLSRKITVDVKGEVLQLKETINTMVDQLNAFAGEVTRVAREVGTDGRLGGQARVEGVSGVWKDLTNNVNLLAGNLTAQVRNIAEVTTAVANGDLSKKITVEVKGEVLELKNTINVMVDQLNAFAGEVTRVAREVGTEGKLGGQARVEGVSGVWKDLTNNVNLLAGNLTAQVRNIAEVTTAVANGDLSKKITVDVRGEILELKNTINVMVDQLNAFAGEVTRVAREVGTEGKLGGQAQVAGGGGVWKDLTNNVNLLAGNLTAQVRNIAEVTTAVANGDLSKKITVDVRGEVLQLKETINTMVDQLNAFASEVTRVAREVGTEGKLGGQAQVAGVGGVWKDLTGNVNLLAGNLTAQVRNIADVTTAVANGDLSKKITVDVRGEILELKNTINVMVDQLNAFAGEVTRVAREVGTEGKLGGQAQVAGVGGVWKDLTGNVNLLAGNLTDQVRNIADVTTAVANGDLSKKIKVDVRGEVLQLKETINTMVDQLNAFAGEVTRVAREVGTEGRLGGQAFVPGVSGVWKDLTDNVNGMASNLTAQVRNIAAVTTAVAAGDLSRKITVEVKGEVLELKETINTMVDQLNAFAGEVTRVAREVGTEGKLGGQAVVRGVSGTWKDLTDSVNLMAENLTEQVRGIAKVVTAVAAGDLKQKMVVPAKGEVAKLADTINNTVDTLATFSDQVTLVAREVGVEGRLGGQATVPGAAGRWRELVDNVNELAANLTTQVRAIADVATAVTRGDLTRAVSVEARGEVADLKDNVNTMIGNLRETTRQNTEQDWLKTNLAKFTRMLQGQRDLMTVARALFSELAPLVRAAHGAFYLMDGDSAQQPEIAGHGQLRLLASYGFNERRNVSNVWRVGQGLVGQAAFEKQRILLTNVPPDYVQITSGLGQGTPLNIIVLPVLFEGRVKAVIELASFELFSAAHQSFLDQLTESLAIVLNTIEAGARTEALLKESQTLAGRLQSQQEELQQSNEELEEKARLLSAQNAEVERKNREINVARLALVEKAEQLALTSKYKSEFLANMSHELRTPLNSLLILAQQLEHNKDGNLTETQVKFAHTIHGAGTDLLHLINDILDLSKIESGTVTPEVAEVQSRSFREDAERLFAPVAAEKGLAFVIDLDPVLPRTITTDGRRVQQVIKNLLSNALKFTPNGSVEFSIRLVQAGWSSDHEVLQHAESVIAFSVKDTGIGIAPENQKTIFEAFQQADGSTTRKYGGTGLGLAISREIAHLLGGELRVQSTLGQGSTFTLYLPQVYVGPHKPFGSAVPASPALAARKESVASMATAEPPPLGTVEDDRREIGFGDRVLLVVEDDPKFATVVADMARGRGFKVLISQRGEQAVALVREFKPAAVILDLLLPDVGGWTVLDRIKFDPATRHIPVHVMTVADEDSRRALDHGAFAFLKKPVSHEELTEALARIEGITGAERVARLLLAEDNEAEATAIREMIGAEDVDITTVRSGEAALAAVKTGSYDCVVLDLRLPDISGQRVLELLRAEPALRELPVIVYTAAEPDGSEQDRLKSLAQSVIVKGGRSSERLLAETALFLHRVTADLPEEKRKVIEAVHQSDTALAGRKVLLVDDDTRNLYALTAVLEAHGMSVIVADNGRQALQRLQAENGVDIVLMDMMMPEMDGYAAMRAIRRMPERAALPILALTAKAMKGDREKCLQAGASDYISKPIHTDQLLSLMRVWLYR